MKIQKTLRKYNGFVLPDAKNPNMSIGYFGFSIKIQKKKTTEIQKSKNPKLSGFLDFWIFLKIVCLLFAVQTSD